MAKTIPSASHRSSNTGITEVTLSAVRVRSAPSMGSTSRAPEGTFPAGAQSTDELPERTPTVATVATPVGDARAFGKRSSPRTARCLVTHRLRHQYVPHFVSIVSPTSGSRGSSTSWTSFQPGVSIVIMNRLMGHMMQDGVARRSGISEVGRSPTTRTPQRTRRHFSHRALRAGVTRRPALSRRRACRARWS